MVDFVGREVDDLNARIREMRAPKRDVESLIEEAERQRAIEGEKDCPLITHHEPVDSAPSVGRYCNTRGKEVRLRRV